MTDQPDTIDSTNMQDILVAGLPGPLMNWTIDLVSRHYPLAAHVPLVTQEHWTPPDPDPRLFFADVLPESWIQPIQAGRVKAILVLDDPATAWDTLCRLGQPPDEAARNLVKIAMSLCHRGDQFLTLTRTAPAALILNHLGARADAPVADRPLSLPIPHDLRPLFDGVLNPIFDYAAGNPRQTTTWPRDTLLWGDKPGTALPRVLDLTGGSRILAYGPYFALPTGRWTMTTTFALSPASRTAILSLSLYGPEQLGRLEFTVETAGLFKASIPVNVPSSREPLEIRLVTERGAIEGTIGIGDITFTPAT